MVDVHLQRQAQMGSSDDTNILVDVDLPIASEDDPFNPLFDKIIRPCLAELVGVMFFVFVGCSTLLSGSLVATALAHGLTIAILIAGFGSISGGHFNPAVTLGVTLANAIHPVIALGYFVAQIIGGILGAACSRGMMNSTIFEAGGGGLQDITTRVATPGQAIFCEMMLTAFLVLTVLMTAVDSKTKSHLAPFAIGLSITVDILIGGGLSAASMNPARAFGPALVISYAKDPWTHHYVYWVGPLLGSLFASILYRLLFASSEKRLIFK